MKKVTIYGVYNPYEGKDNYCASVNSNGDFHITPYEVEVPDDFNPHFTLNKVFCDGKDNFWQLDGKTSWAFEGKGADRKMHTHHKVWVENWDTGERITLIDTDTTA
ncbi:MAG: hypothetical protein LUD78_04965 [Clostridiales bacterium]|nr:hypothetical protein [Clostridiales bacterium]